MGKEDKYKPICGLVQATLTSLGPHAPSVNEDNNRAPRFYTRLP